MDEPRLQRDDFTIRPARREDASDMAALIDIAGHGLPSWLWSSVFDREAGTSVFEAGRERARRDTGGFSWQNAWVAAAGGLVGGLVLGYKLPDEVDPSGLEGLPPIIRPLVELENEAPGSWYLNAIATYREHRGIGLGGRLLTHAIDAARKSGAARISLIAEDVNDVAMRLYVRHRFEAKARRPFIPFPSGPRAAEWVLMVRELH